MTPEAPKPTVSAEARTESKRVDAIDQYRKFSIWWTRTIQTDVPGPASHYFDTWMASARTALAGAGR